MLAEIRFHLGNLVDWVRRTPVRISHLVNGCPQKSIVTMPYQDLRGVEITMCLDCEHVFDVQHRPQR